MFRFSVRDLLWLTLVVALALGWFVRERELQVKLGQSADKLFRAERRATKWRGAAGALELGLKEEGGWETTWNFPAEQISIYKQTQASESGTVAFGRVLPISWEPSTDEE